MEYFRRNNPSFTWRSIWSSRQLVKLGTMWIIEDGKSINVWRDPWLKDDNNFFTINPQIAGLEHLTVNELLIPGLCEWDMNLLEEYFCERDVDEILKIPRHDSDDQDSLIWRYSKTGNYTVRSGYKLLVNSIIDEQFGIEGNWGKIWKLKVPAKVKFFLWRAVEILHKKAYISLRIFASWLFALMEKTTPSTLARIVMLIWNIWKQRNGKLWRSNHTNPTMTVHNALSFLDVWRTARLRTQVSMEEILPQCKNWHPPQSSTLKCNIDAAFFRELHKVGIGRVLCDDTGAVLLCRTMWFMGGITVLEGESR
ncbi:hypothetical protein DH2020_022236 [Rehmannia glutinosa]|uniref:Uncharacterized protein n=1 Tax=Rehmannia glutinosa TaxID=99300 RepID=A0ABR0WCT1_REHGL